MNKRGNNAQLNNINKITEIYQKYPKILFTLMQLRCYLLSLQRRSFWGKHATIEIPEE